MPSIDIPTLGTLVLGATLVSAAFTIGVSAAAAGGRPHLLRSARFGTLATIALVAAAVCLLAYAFQAHDFRIRYVARYSDRSMSPLYLWTALWGGQDGSLLWWCFLLSGYTGAFTLWVKGRYRELQPVMFAVLMSVLSFFVVLQLFAANPFATSYGAPPADGEGLNPLLQNYWMVVHPPALYLGLTGWTVPFAFVVAALVTGRLDEEWIHAARKWVLVAFAFLSLGNLLGAFWSYEELGWGGYWAWDPVENASFLPWLTGTAYLHSVMIQERRGILKVWNVFLLAATFVLTIFGTFLTRSGLIASVHSFARSDIGDYFVWFLIALALFCYVLIGWRLPDLRAGQRIGVVEALAAVVVGVLVDSVLLFAGAGLTGLMYGAVAAVPLALLAPLKGIELLRLDVLKIRPLFTKKHVGIESLVSREFAFLFNNWILLAMTIFVFVATTFPLISEWLRDETITVGPPYYNKWMVPFGLILLFTTGVGPLLAWRKATGANLVRAFRWPVLAAAVVLVLHLLLGERAGFAPFVEWRELHDTTPYRILAAIYSVAPLASSTLCTFVLATIVQEFWRGTAVRRRTTKESIPVALVNLVSRARRRYGGYIVHLGVVSMFVGFTGTAWDEEREASLRPGQSMEVGGYEFRYDRVRTEVDPNKRAIYADVTILRDGEEIGHASPAKFVYRTHPEMPTTEVAIRSTLAHDLYVIMSTVDPETHRAAFRIQKHPLVVWIWIGGALLLFGVFIAVFPRLSELTAPATERAPARAGALAGVLLALGIGGALLAPGLARAQSDGTSTLHAGTVEIHDPIERQLFERLLCECGDCQRLPLDSCGCSWAEGMRAELRGRLARGDEISAIVDDYRRRFGAGAISVPADEGLDRALWALPVAGIVLAALGLVVLGRRWVRAGREQTEAALREPEAQDGEYDERLEEELRRLEGD
ncbi:MAG TPA: cytochrome c-type biogenesis CcmF C-terminal domain-containing protein [Sandaracinaceae bacterium]